MGHRQYLPLSHPWRKNRKTFDGNQKVQCAPDVPSKDEILRQLKVMPFGDENVGKTRSQSNKNKGEKRKKDTSNEQQPESNNVLWKKKSIFFRLSY